MNDPRDHRFLKGFVYAMQGIQAALRTQRNMRIHLVVAVFALIACYFLQVEFWGWIVILMLIGFVVIAELLNTAIEAAVDLACPTEHPHAKYAKDVAAGAVLFAAILAVVVGLAIYIHAFCRLFGF